MPNFRNPNVTHKNEKTIDGIEGIKVTGAPCGTLTEYFFLFFDEIIDFLTK